MTDEEAKAIREIEDMVRRAKKWGWEEGREEERQRVVAVIKNLRAGASTRLEDGGIARWVKTGMRMGYRAAIRAVEQAHTATTQDAAIREVKEATP